MLNLLTASLRLSPHFFPYAPMRLFLSPNQLFFHSPHLRKPRTLSSTAKPSDRLFAGSPVTGMEDVLMGYVFGRKRATEVAHLVWERVIRKGDTVVDATCGNGHDTLAMLRMGSDESGRAHVYSMDIQKDAIKNTTWLLDASLSPIEKKLVKLFNICHSKMDDVVPVGAEVRLVAFNLGYLPGGNKAVKTTSETTLAALEVSKRIIAPGGLISIVAYVGHPGGREEFMSVETFASGLPMEDWCCCKIQMLNRPLAPVLVFLFKK